MKQKKFIEPYINPLKKLLLQKKFKNEEVKELQNEQSHIKNQDSKTKLIISSKKKNSKSKINSKEKTNGKIENKVKEALIDNEKRIKIEKLNQYYQNVQNKILINKLGVDIFTYNKVLEENLIPSNFLFRHKIIPDIRSKMVNWMCEVFYAYKSSFQTYYIAVDIMDKYFNYSKRKLKNKDVHLIGLTCIFIASKYEDIIPFSMKNILSDIGKNKFTKKQILMKEKEILKEINFDIISVSTFDFVNIFIYDLKMNNLKVVKSLNLNKYLHIMRKTCLFLSQMILLDELFSSYEPSLKALCCLICSYDALLSSENDISLKVKKFLKSWILFNINESNFTQDEINCLYERLSFLYKNIKELTEEGSNDCFNIVKIFLNEDLIKSQFY